MTISKAIGSYQDVRDAFDKALEEPNGIKISLASENEATRLAMRFNMFRKLDREQSRKIFPTEDPRYNVSAYDVLQVRKVESAIYIQRPPPIVFRKLTAEEA